MIARTPKPKPLESFRLLVATLRLPTEPEIRSVEQLAAQCVDLLEKAEERGRK